MHNNSDCWLGPRLVATPDLVDDIRRFIDADMSQERLLSVKTENRTKLVLVTERLELIDHLQAVLWQVKKQKTVTRTCEAARGDKCVVTETYDVVLWEHQFAGFDFDLDSLCIYLYLTCIDTIKGQPEHVDAFDWLSALDQEATFSATPIDWKRLQSAYREEHGLSRRFKEAFISDLGPNTQELLVTSLAVVKLGSRCVEPSSWDAWAQRSPEAKVRKIADHLYTIRSTFTHISFRTFSPEMPVSLLPDRGDTLIRRSDRPCLCEILNRVVTELAKTLLS